MDEAILYIIYSPVYKAVKIGISDISGRRFKAHRTKGWLLVAYWHFFERDKARQIESLVIQTLRKKHKPFLHKEDMPQNGYTETFDSRKVSKKGLIRMVNKAIKDLNIP
jgi:predicted GIY-YIG superfamily endonuclease